MKQTDKDKLEKDVNEEIDFILDKGINWNRVFDTMIKDKYPHCKSVDNLKEQLKHTIMDSVYFAKTNEELKDKGYYESYTEDVISYKAYIGIIQTYCITIKTSIIYTCDTYSRTNIEVNVISDSYSSDLF